MTYMLSTILKGVRFGKYILKSWNRNHKVYFTHITFIEIQARVRFAVTKSYDTVAKFITRATTAGAVM